MSTFNDARVRPANDRPTNNSGGYVLYWCQMGRRLRANHALDYAAHWANELKKPLVVYEGLKLNYPWASARFHKFMLEGMRDNAADAAALGLTYWPFVESPERSGRGLVAKLCQNACLLITDDHPQFISPAQIRAVAADVEIAVHAVDNNGMIPLAKLGKPVAAAAHLRPRIHKLFAEAWQHRANSEPDLTSAARKAVAPPFEVWEPPADITAFVASLPVDPSVPPVAASGGPIAGRKLLADFVEHKLPHYAASRNQPDHPDSNSASGLSWYLHYGHVGIQEVCEAVLGPDWSPDLINPAARGRDEFYCRDASTNAFLDEAITWRDVGYSWHYGRIAELGTRNSESSNVSWQNAGEEMPSFNFDTFDFSPLAKGGTLAQVLPAWAQETLGNHLRDRREHVYTPDQFEAGETHDELWNAAQRELVATGRMHNYLRMLWAKKVLEWSDTPEEAYRVLEHLNNKYAVDGRDPNSYTGILWCFGLFDRPWPGDRAVFGTVRFMSSGNTAKKFKLKGYYEYVHSLPTIAAVRAGETAAANPGRLF